MAVTCRPFPVWRNILTDSTSFTVNSTISYYCKPDHTFTDESEGTNKQNTCNYEGLWGDFVSCQATTNETADKEYWTPAEAPGAHYYGYGVIAILGLFMLFLVILDANMWYYALKPVIKRIKKLIRRCKRKHCKGKEEHDESEESDSDEEVVSSAPPRATAPVDNFKFFYLRDQLRRHQQQLLLLKQKTKQGGGMNLEDGIPEVVLNGDDGEEEDAFVVGARHGVITEGSSLSGRSVSGRRRNTRRMRENSESFEMEERDNATTPSSGYGSALNLSAAESGDRRRGSVDRGLLQVTSPGISRRTGTPRFAPQSRADVPSRLVTNERKVIW